MTLVYERPGNCDAYRYLRSRFIAVERNPNMGIVCVAVVVTKSKEMNRGWLRYFIDERNVRPRTV